MLEHVCNLGTVVDARNTAARAEDQARENLSAAVHGPGEPGVTSIGVASAKLRSAESRAGSADATGLEVVLQPNGWKWRDRCWSPTADVSSRAGVAHADIRDGPTTA
jgi:hypothetical protein